MNSAKQQGVAIVVAMLVLALVTVFSISMAVEYNFSIQRVRNQMVAQQAFHYLRGTEAIAHKVLSIDLMVDRDNGVSVDKQSELWAKEMPPFALEDGSYTAKLTDLAGRFNLNSLRKTNLNFPNNQLKPTVPYTMEQGIFMRLLLALGDDQFTIDETQAQAITEAVVDYLDEDQEPSGFNCGEDDAYYSIDGRQPHRTPNKPFLSVSELRLICNMPVELYERLRPFVTVWPVNGNALLNVNSASMEVMRSILVTAQDAASLQAVQPLTSFQPPPPIDGQGLEAFFEKQKMGYDNMGDVTPDLGGYQMMPNYSVGLSSNYFLLQSMATIGDITQVMNSVISREGGNIDFVARSMGSL